MMHYKYIDIFSGFLDDQVSQSELAAFIAYATAFPEGFLALIDTYDVIRSELS
jgi:nicotinate phosphoribosyltransferase